MVSEKKKKKTKETLIWTNLFYFSQIYLHDALKNVAIFVAEKLLYVCVSSFFNSFSSSLQIGQNFTGHCVQTGARTL